MFNAALNPSCENKNDLPDIIFSFYSVSDISKLTSRQTVNISLTPDEYIKSYLADDDVKCELGMFDHDGIFKF